MRLIEERPYTIRIGKMQEYLDLFEREAVPLLDEYCGMLEACFTVETGELNQVIQFRSYPSWEERNESVARLRIDPRFEELMSSLRPLIVRQQGRILKPTSFSPIR